MFKFTFTAFLTYVLMNLLLFNCLTIKAVYLTNLAVFQLWELQATKKVVRVKEVYSMETGPSAQLVHVAQFLPLSES